MKILYVTDPGISAIPLHFRIRSGAVDRIEDSIVVNPGGFWQNWFENEQVGVPVDYQDYRVISVSLIVGNEISHPVSDLRVVSQRRRIRWIEDLL